MFEVHKKTTKSSNLDEAYDMLKHIPNILSKSINLDQVKNKIILIVYKGLGNHWALKLPKYMWWIVLWVKRVVKFILEIQYLDDDALIFQKITLIKCFLRWW